MLPSYCSFALRSFLPSLSLPLPTYFLCPLSYFFVQKNQKRAVKKKVGRKVGAEEREGLEKEQEQGDFYLILNPYLLFDAIE